MKNLLFKKTAFDNPVGTGKQRFRYPEAKPELSQDMTSEWGNQLGGYFNKYVATDRMQKFINETICGKQAAVPIGQRRSKVATGEMSREDVTRETYPAHFAIADALEGTVEPFDVYQGPYIDTKYGRLFIATEEGGLATVWNEANTNESNAFFYDNENEAVDAALSTIPNPPEVKPYGEWKQEEISGTKKTKKTPLQEKSHSKDCAQRHGGECTCGAFEHNERVRNTPPKPIKDRKIRKTPQFSEEDKIYLHGLGVAGSLKPVWDKATRTGMLQFSSNRYSFTKDANVAVRASLKDTVVRINCALNHRRIPKNASAHEAAVKEIAKLVTASNRNLDKMGSLAKKAAKATHVLYDAGPSGYTVRVMKGGDTIDEYNGGNAPFGSTEQVDRTDSDSIKYERLLEYAESTAKEMAQEFGVPESMVDHDEDLLAEEREEAWGLNEEDEKFISEIGPTLEKVHPEYGQSLNDALAFKDRLERQPSKFDEKFLKDLHIESSKKTAELKDNLLSIKDVTTFLNEAWESSIKNSAARNYMAGLIDSLRWADRISDEEHGIAYNTYVYSKTAPDAKQDSVQKRLKQITRKLWKNQTEEERLFVARHNPKQMSLPLDGGDKTSAYEGHWWPYGRHQYEPQEGTDICKACKLPAGHKLHTTPPPSSPEEAMEEVRVKRTAKKLTSKFLTHKACISSEFCPQCGNTSDHCSCLNKAELLDGKTVGGHLQEHPEEREEFEKTSSVKTAAVYPVVKEGGEWYIKGLPSKNLDDEETPDTFIIPGMHYSISTSTGLVEGLYVSLYDEFQVNDNLKEGDIFDTPVGQFVCEGVHVIPYDETAKASVATVNDAYRCANCGCDKGEHRVSYEDGDEEYYECRIHPDTCKKYKPKG